MSRYDLPGGVENLYEPGSGGRVLRNKLGVTDKTRMDELEFEAFVRTQSEYLNRITNETQFTASLICEMHREWLGGIYDWAGEYRKVNVAKGVFKWPPWTRVEENMNFLEESSLADLTPCQPGDVADVAAEIAEVHADLLLVHPFLDGNGRLARWLANLMALQAGLPEPVYGFGGDATQRDRYLSAVQKGYTSDYEDLRDFFVDALERAFASEDS